MTLLAPSISKASVTDLREQFASLVSDLPAPTDPLGKLPESPTHPRKRETLHLNSSLKNTTIKTPT